MTPTVPSAPPPDAKGDVAAPPDPVVKRPTQRLCLYLAGSTAASARAIVNTRAFCERHLSGCYELEIVDISLHPERVAQAQIVAAPTLVRSLPPPVRRFIGDMSKTDRMLRIFGLPGLPPA